MFKIGDKVLVRINWSRIPKDSFNLQSIADMDGKIGEIVGPFGNHLSEKGSYKVLNSYVVLLMDATDIDDVHYIQVHHLIKIDDDDATPDTKSEWKVNDVWTPSKNINKKVLTS